MLLGFPGSPRAGTYSVEGGCGNWDPVNLMPSRIAVYTECPMLFVRNVGGPFSSGVGAEGRWEFSAPPGAGICRAFIAGSIIGGSGWQATIYTETGAILENCPGLTCAGGGKSYGADYGPLNSTRVYLRVRCGASSCPNNQGLKGFIDARTIRVTIADGTTPGLQITGGDALSGWRHGMNWVNYDAADNVGIKLARVLLDGSPREQQTRGCAWGQKVPCPNGPGALAVDTSKVADGPRLLTVQVVDSADNVASEDRTIYVDNTAPAAMQGLTVVAGDGWRPQNRFELAWQNPKQAHAPIDGIEYELCPAANGDQDRRGCVAGRVSGTDLANVNDLQVPVPGDWRGRFWLRDAAGNHDSRTALEARLRLDTSPPDLVFLEQHADDPARLRVRASDAVSSIARGEVEVRREGTDAWMSLPVQAEAAGFSAFLDDEVLTKGRYELRARAFDQAGNERTTSSRENGQPAVLAIPVRARSRLVVGRPGRLRCTRRDGRRRCRRPLTASPSLSFGQRIRLRGRLMAGGEPLNARTVEVWSQTKAAGATWSRVGEVQTAPTGRFSLRVGRGRARLLRFRYAGSPTIRGRTAVVDLRVKAATTLRPNRRQAVNGEYVTFRGRLLGRPIPPGGKLVELQVFTRRRWRTFAQPRASETTGRWTFQYRFEAIRGRVTFRFRARVRREASYPFHSGTSRQVRVQVRGL